MCTRFVAGSLFVVLVVSASWAQTPLGTAFTYQGQLKSAGSPANGLHDLRFRLYDAFAGGAQVGPTLCANNVSVTEGLFTVSLDFGAQFAGDQRFLEIDVRADTGLNCANPAGFVTLAPRQALTAAPNAIFALNADRLDGLDSTAFLQAVPSVLSLKFVHKVVGRVPGFDRRWRSRRRVVDRRCVGPSSCEWPARVGSRCGTRRAGSACW